MNLVVMSLLDMLAHPHISSVDEVIARYILENHEKVQNMSISDLSNQLGVSNSQISRFVRHVGFSSFVLFKESLSYHGTAQRHSMMQRGIKQKLFQQYLHEDIDYFYTHFDYQQGNRLIDILHDNDVALFGIFNSENYARELQYNLALHQKVCTTFIDIYKQVEYIKKSHGWIIIYSLSGEYVLDNGYSRYYGIVKALKESQARILVITSHQDIASLDYIDEIVFIPHLHNQTSYLIHCFNDWVLSAYLERFPKDGNKK